MYKLSQHINPNKIFIINRSELEGRLDAQFYREAFNFDSFSKLSNYALVKGGKRIPLGMDYAAEETPYLYLRVADINIENAVNYNTFKFIDQSIFDILERYEIKENDLAISIAGTIGKTILLKNIPTGKRVILTENCAKIIIKDSNILAEYLELVLNLSIVQKQIELNYIQTTIPKLGLDRINNLKLPPFPNKSIQQQIIDIYQTAYQQKQEKETQAQALLASIDDYLLGELGITIPTENIVYEPVDLYGFELNKHNSLVKKGRLFLTGFREIGGGRFDPEYISKIHYIESLQSKYPFIAMKDILVKQPQYGANEEAIDGNCQIDTRYIRITDIDEIGNLKQSGWKTAVNIEEQYSLSYNDVLFARSGSVGKCYIHKETSNPAIFAGYLIRFVFNEKVNPDYIFYYCNSKLYWFWIRAIQRPAVQSNINSEEYKSLKIPLPPLEKQNKIVQYISEIRKQVKDLQIEATNILYHAKEKVEQIILQ